MTGDLIAALAHVADIDIDPGRCDVIARRLDELAADANRVARFVDELPETRLALRFDHAESGPRDGR